MIKAVFKFAIGFFVTVLINSCHKDTYVWNVVPTCTDGLQNGKETGIDCGGSCPSVCSDSGLAHTKKYYVSFLYDGVPVVFQSDTDYVSQDPGSSTVYGNVTSAAGLSGPYASLSFDVPMQDLDAIDLMTFNHSTFYFETQSSNLAGHFKFKEANGVNATTYQTSPQDSTNFITIEDAIVDDGLTPQGNAKVLFSGKFAARLINTSNGSFHTITKGTFGVDFGSIH